MSAWTRGGFHQNRRTYPASGMAAWDGRFGVVRMAVEGRTPLFHVWFKLGTSFMGWELIMEQLIHTAVRYMPWNKGKLVGQKAPLKLKDIWAIRVRLQIGKRTRELALFNLAIDSKLRSCDLVKLRVRDV
jgi:hypothetical protein